MFEARDLSFVEGQPDEDEQIEVGSRLISDLPADLSDATSIAAWSLWSGRTASSGLAEPLALPA